MLHHGYILFAVSSKQSQFYSLPETNRPGSEWTELNKNWICGITSLRLQLGYVYSAGFMFSCMGWMS